MTIDINNPDPSGYQAEIIEIGLQKWVQCPFCKKKQFPITAGAVIIGQMFICRGSKCKKEFEVNYPVDFHPNR